MVGHRLLWRGTDCYDVAQVMAGRILLWWGTDCYGVAQIVMVGHRLFACSPGSIAW
jgi:hypothetical protein